MKLAGKHVAVLGAGRSGLAAAALARREGARVSLWDSGEIAADKVPAGVEIHPHAGEEQGRGLVCDVLVTSPGIDTYGPYVRAFGGNAGELIGEVELAFRFYQGRVVGITGTNGKTTCTELVGRILAEAGMGGDSCGNYGPPLSEIVMKEDAPAAVALELSSFQLETIRTLRPDVAVWLNFAPDHMDRYPTVEAYKEAKLRVFDYQVPGDLVVVRTGENLPELEADVVEFSTDDPEADWFSNGVQILHDGAVVLDLEQHTSLRGLHNAENAMAAMAACAHFGIPLETMRKALKGYAPPPHRCELIRTLDGVEYLNDSKATNLHALESALRSQSRPVVLIAGGKEKGLDYGPLVPVLQEKALAAVTFGEIGEPLSAVFSQAVPTQAVETLEQALAAAQAAAPVGSTVLLSPGTSSFDQFNSYVHRGDCFRDLVLSLC
ncbi:MAG: UDP-N-acetylmuramoyl-L-alanine--D-glutamate ligase [Verrucomicrobiales bacterium]|nr:UDP-N-acetylmuramoyl-L-alanine--D-glutamate ligase [Verrucomicrobiota bacterium JB025]